MSDTTNLIQILTARWNMSLAEQAVQDIAARYWASQDQEDEPLLALAEQMRQALRQQLSRSTVPVEQIRLLEISHKLELGVGRRDVALSLAKNLRHLAERKADTLHQARSAFLLAQAWYWVSALPFSIDWSKRGFGEAKPLEQKSQGGRPYRVMYAYEEVQLALRLGLQGGMYDQAGRLIADAIKRYQAINDSSGEAGALAVLAQLHMLQGRWTESVETSNQLRQMADAVPNAASSLAGLWAGARAAAILGDASTAISWVDQALQTSRQPGDRSAEIASLSAKGTILSAAGDTAAALAMADQAVHLATRWRHDILLRWVMLERSWIRLAMGQADVDEARQIAEAFSKFGAGVLEARAGYALYRCLKASGQDAQTDYAKALEQFERLKMDWHLAKARAGEPLA